MIRKNFFLNDSPKNSEWVQQICQMWDNSTVPIFENAVFFLGIFSLVDFN